ncbi:hypothetical protein [Vibrio diazotrophicus]|uniref:hypothetical protein n=1 Tax=Vibrio diazotrophicus TaxID=685 RepID=UPI000C9EB9A2|nr:hypothetical protein [Vibrio diazotrophicus]PNH91802.1 hypothetical protein C1O24_21025 [Vibrio diazotrophicus]
MEIESWIKSNAVFGLKLPDGWFGRPYDNQHKLTWVADRDNKLILELDNQMYLTFTKPIQLKASDSEFIVDDFQQIIFVLQVLHEVSAMERGLKT